ncbi:MAG: TonB-dependent siderophore receptor, partial [Propionibacteriaceae bacterium]
LDAVTLQGAGIGGKGYTSGTTKGYQPVTTSLGSGTDTPILDLPQAVSVVSDTVLADQGTRSLEEALWNISGVIQTNTLGGTQDAFLRRGFGDNRDGGVLTDGLKTALSRSFNATTERVEVLKGPSSALYGILDPGGLINVVTKKPEYDFSGSVEGWLTSFGGGGGSTDVTGPVGETGLAYRLITEYEDTNYWRNFGETERKVIAPSFAYQTETTRIDASYLQESYAVPFDRGTVFDLTTGDAVDAGRRTRFDEAYNVTDGMAQLATVGVTHALDDDWTLRLNYAYSEAGYYDNQARVTAYDPRTGLLTRRADATQDSTIAQHSARADTVGSVEVAGLQHDLLFGASYDHSDTLRTDLIRGPSSRRFDIDAPVYGHDSVHLKDRWIVVGGLRYQYYDQTAGKGRPFNLNTDQQDGEVVPRAGVVFKASDDVSLYANWSRSFKPISLAIEEF